MTFSLFGRPGRDRYRKQPFLDNGTLMWRDAPERSLDTDVLRGVDKPFTPDGGLRVLDGNLGRSVIKISAVAEEHRAVTAPARVFDDQHEFTRAFAAGEIDHDVVVVIRNQGPSANGMPELHGLTPSLSVLMKRGYQVALVTDGRMSGASGTVPAAIQLIPEAANGGPLSRVRDGDTIRLDAEHGTVDVLVEEAEFTAREAATTPTAEAQYGTGRELFSVFRQAVGRADQGASVFTGTTTSSAPAPKGTGA